MTRKFLPLALLLPSLAIARQTDENKGLLFDGQDDYATYHIGEAQRTHEENFSCGATIKIYELNDKNTILSSEDGGQGYPFYFGVSSEGLLELELNGKYYLAEGKEEYSLTDEDCHHVAVTLSADEVLFYVDTVVVANLQAQMIHSLTDMDYLWVGNYPPQEAYGFNGIIDDVRGWNTTRTQSQIADNLYNIDFDTTNIDEMFLCADFQFLKDHTYFEDYLFNENYGELGSGNSSPEHVTSCYNQLEMELSSMSMAASSPPVSGNPPPCDTIYPCNLLCNGGFELMDSVIFSGPQPGVFFSTILQPDNQGVSDVTHWKATEGTPDLFVRGVISSGGIPSNMVTYWSGFPSSIQTWDWPAPDNDAYAHLHAYKMGNTPWNEGIQTPLDHKLKANTQYEISFYAYTGSAGNSNQNSTHKQYILLNLKDGSTTYTIGGGLDSLVNLSLSSGNGWIKFTRTFSLPSQYHAVFDSLEIKAVSWYNGDWLYPYDDPFLPQREYDISSLIDDVELKSLDPNNGLPVVMYVDSVKYPNFDDCPGNYRKIGTDAAGNVYAAMLACENTTSQTYAFDFHDNAAPPVTIAPRAIILMKIGQECGRAIDWVHKIEAQMYITAQGDTGYTAFTLDGMDVSDDGHIYLAGNSGRGDIDFGNGRTTSVAPSPGGGLDYNRDVWVALFDSTGTCLAAETHGDPRGAQLVYDLVHNETNQSLILTGWNDAESDIWQLFGSQNSPAEQKFLMTWDVSGHTLANDVPMDLGHHAARLVAEDGDDLYLFIHEHHYPNPAWDHYIERYDLANLAPTSTPVHTSPLIIPPSAAAFPFTGMEARQGKLYIAGNTNASVLLNGSGSTATQTATSEVKDADDVYLWTGFVTRYSRQLAFEARYSLQPGADASGYALHPDLYTPQVYNHAMTAGELAINHQGETVLNLTAMEIEVNNQRYYSDKASIAVVKFDSILDPVWCNFTTGDAPHSWGDICVNEDNEDEYFISYYVGPNLQEYDADTVQVPAAYFSLYIQNIEDQDTAAIFRTGGISGVENTLPASRATGLQTDALEPVEGEGIWLYPNPAGEQLSVACNGQDHLRALRLIDTKGRLIYARDYDEGQIKETKLDVSGLAPGLYLVQVQTGRGQRVISLQVR